MPYAQEYILTLTAMLGLGFRSQHPKPIYTGGSRGPCELGFQVSLVPFSGVTVFCSRVRFSLLSFVSLVQILGFSVPGFRCFRFVVGVCGRALSQCPEEWKPQLHECQARL